MAFYISSLLLIGFGPTDDVTIPDHYCGLYATHAALKAIGAPVSFEALCDRRYVGSYQGSSLAELEQAVKDNGAYVQSMKGMTVTALMSSDRPVILHVRRMGLNAEYNHWVTYLGVDESSKARIVDPPFDMAPIEFAELNALWDGIGLVVSERPIGQQTLMLASMAEGVAALTVILVAMVLLRVLFRHKHALLAKAGAAAACAVLASFGSTSFLRNPNAVGLVFGHHYDPKLREIEPDEMKRIVRDRTHLIIDCRFASDYAAGHIPTARNLPVTSGPAQQMAFLKDHPTSTKVVVYCQSPSCSWAKSFGSAIYHFGYRDTAIFVGGFSAWNKDDGQ